MPARLYMLCATAVLFAAAQSASADRYDDTIQLFKNAGQSAAFFDQSYGYAVFPTVGKAGLGVGAGRGTGRVFRKDKYVGDTTLTQVSVGLQAGGQSFSQIIFFQDQRAFDEFTSGRLTLDASVSAVAITAAAGSSAGTSGKEASASGGSKNATTAGGFNRGVAVFTIVRGGAMGQAVVAGQKFSYTPLAGGDHPSPD